MLKTKTIKTDKATLLVVELPEGAKFIRIETNQAVVPYGQEVNYEVPATKESYGYEETEGFALPEGNWLLLGRLPDITENDWKGVVDDYDNGYFYYPDGYKDTCDTATESGLSLMQYNEVYFDNPLGERPVQSRERIKLFGTFYYINRNAIELDKWQEAQSKVWDKERCYLFIKVD